MRVRQFSSIVIIVSVLSFAPPSHAFFGKLFEPMTEMVKQAGSVANNIIDTGGNSFTEMVNLTKKLADDIGTMANRILEMADKIGEMSDRIGEMADRIVKTEELMAQLTATLAGKGNLDLGVNAEITERLDRIELLLGSAASVVLTINDSFVAVNYGPTIEISDNPAQYQLYVSLNGLFAQGQTVVTTIEVADDAAFDVAWEKSIKTLLTARSSAKTFSVAVKSIAESGAVSSLSNGVEVTIQ